MIPKQPFGRTGHQSSRTILGGFAVGQCTQAEADRVLDLLLKYGVNHIDTAPGYNDSELRIGPWMKHHRREFFLATKVPTRTYAEARDQIHKSLERLQVDSVELLQLHNLIDPKEWDIAMGPGGALEAIIEAKEQGITRFLGVTGHGVVVAERHLASLAKFDFDTVLLPYNFPIMRNPEYVTDFENLLAVCKERNVAVQTIKSLAKGEWGDVTPTYTTWYRPLESQADVDRAVHWVLGNSNVFLNTTGDMTLLPRILDAAARIQSRPSDGEMEAMVAEQAMTPLFT